MRYFFQFMKWFWTKNLTDGLERLTAVLALWFSAFIITTLISFFFGTPYITVFGWFMGLSLATCGVAFVCFVIGIFYLSYLDWQDQVVNKLKGK